MSNPFFKSIRANLLLGIMIVTPLALTAFIVMWLFRQLTGNDVVLFLAQNLMRLLPANLQNSQHHQWMLQGVAVFLLLLMFFAIGVMVRSFLGKKLYALGEMIISRIPIVNKIYVWIRQISEGFVAQKQSLFKEVVVIPYPRAGLYSLGFLTADTPQSIHQSAELKTPHVSVFLPTTPNPTSGMMIFVPRADVHKVNMSISDAMKMIISAGAVFPGNDLLDQRPTLLDKLENWLVKERQDARKMTVPPPSDNPAA